jgi:hypothetical protein
MASPSRSQGLPTQPTTAYDWKRETKDKATNKSNEKTKDQSFSFDPLEIQFYDDGTITFFW